MRKTRSFIVTAILAAALIVPSIASAQVDLDAYRGTGPQVQEEISQGGGSGGDSGGPTGEVAPTAVAATPSGADAAGDEEGGDLPFTGLDVALVLVAGIVLLGMGLGMRRLVRPSEVA